jgi:Cdc6-like AAA superfamily ATPase
VILDIYGSKLLKTIRKLPRSHLILLNALTEYLEDHSDETDLREQKVLSLFNQAATRLLVDRINLSELNDICQTLSNCDILIVSQGNQSRKSKQVLGRQASLSRLSISNNSKHFSVSLKCELEDLAAALKTFMDSEGHV